MNPDWCVYLSLLVVYDGKLDFSKLTCSDYHSDYMRGWIENGAGSTLLASNWNIDVDTNFERQELSYYTNFID